MRRPITLHDLRGQPGLRLATRHALVAAQPSWTRCARRRTGSPGAPWGVGANAGRLHPHLPSQLASNWLRVVITYPSRALRTP